MTIQAMLLILIFLAIGLIVYLIAELRDPAVIPWLCFQGYSLLVSVPCLLAFFAINSKDNVVTHEGHSLDGALYLAFIGAQLLIILVSLLSYKRGLRHSWVELTKVVQIDRRRPGYLTFLALLITLIFILFAYLCVTIGIESITSPRDVYISTRASSGFVFNLLSISIKTLAIFALFAKNNSQRNILILLSISLSVLIGAKANTYFVLLIIVLHWSILAARKRYKLSLANILFLYIGSVACSLSLLLVTFGLGQNLELFLALSLGYVAEPANNFIMLVSTYSDHFRSHFLGDIAIDHFLYMKMPRFLDPDKSYILGGFKVAYEYYSESMRSNTGSPSFGEDGMWFADFGYIGILFFYATTIAHSFILGVLASTATHISDYSARGIPLVLMILLFSSNGLITSAPANLFIENIVFILLLSIVIKVLGGHRRVLS